MPMAVNTTPQMLEKTINTKSSLIMNWNLLYRRHCKVCIGFLTTPSENCSVLFTNHSYRRNILLYYIIFCLPFPMWIHLNILFDASFREKNVCNKISHSHLYNDRCNDFIFILCIRNQFIKFMDVCIDKCDIRFDWIKYTCSTTSHNYFVKQMWFDFPIQCKWLCDLQDILSPRRCQHFLS